MPSWQWRSEWEVQEEPIAALFREVAAFERPPCTLYKKHHADIVCSVEFSPDGHMLASAGVAKQVSSSQSEAACTTAAAAIKTVWEILSSAVSYYSRVLEYPLWLCVLMHGSLVADTCVSSCRNSRWRL